MQFAADRERRARSVFDFPSYPSKNRMIRGLSAGAAKRPNGTDDVEFFHPRAHAGLGLVVRQ